jgi:hypothetical protein
LKAKESVSHIEHAKSRIPHQDHPTIDREIKAIQESGVSPDTHLKKGKPQNSFTLSCCFFSLKNGA